MTFVAEYIKNGKLIRVYSENGKRTVTKESYKQKVPKVSNGYIPRRRTTGDGH